ncbi:unnamed protein product [marine sediment metagenome]|uniref:O-methyltransferase domain-containing protein n=1 Tax=marine sediment metagenome TaxID=412755 RepID=X1AXM7_9ZZZZ
MSRSANDTWERAAKELKPSLTRNVGPYLYYTARLIEAKTTIEIGIGRGFTSYALGLYAKDFKAVHHTLDWNVDKRDLVRNLNKKFDLDIKFHVGDATAFAWKIPIDLLFVDILGTKMDFMAIFALFTPHMSDKGLIVVHDYFCFENIRDAVDATYRGGPFELLTIPSDGEPRMPGAENNGPCGLAIVRRT